NLLLTGDGLLGALAGAGVGMGPLATNGKAAAVTQALVAADLHLALDVLLDLAAQVTFDLEVVVDVGTKLVHFVVGEVTDPRVGVHAGGRADLLGLTRANPVDVGEGDDEALFARDVDASYTSHRLTLPLLVARVFTDDLHATMAADHLA